MKAQAKPLKILIAIPAMSKIDTPFIQCLLRLKSIGQTAISIYENSLVYAAREALCQQALEQEADYLLFLDSDMTFTPDLAERLLKTAQEEQAEVVSGLCFRRRPPFSPAIWKKIRIGINGQENTVEEYNDYPKNSAFEIDACGAAALLIKTETIAAVFDRFKTAYQPLRSFGEDLSFCIRAKQVGAKIICDSRIKVGHLTQTEVTEETYQRYTKENGQCSQK